jgi:hypothetical protein
MMSKESTPQQAELKSPGSERHECKQMFLGACVVESWIYHMADDGEPDECVMCGRWREHDKGRLLTKAFVCELMRVLDSMLWDVQEKERSTDWSTSSLLRYYDLYVTMPEMNPQYCCDRCFAYTMDSMRALVAEVRNVSLDEATRLLETM